MREYVEIEPFKGRRSRQRWLRDHIHRRSNGFGRRPGRRQRIGERCPGYLDDISGEKEQGTCRIFFQNIGTLPVGTGRYEAEEALEILSKAGVDVSGLTEVNKNEENEYVMKECNEMIRRAMPGARVEIGSNTKYKVEGIRKPGGIMTILSQRLKHMSTTEMDYLGRWSRTQVKGSHKSIVIYTTYVPSDVDLGGPSTIRRKLQHDADGKEGKVQWKDRFYEELVREITRDREQGREVVLGGDFNETMEKGKKMQTELREAGMINVFFDKMGKVPPTREPGRYAIDHVWCTEGILSNVEKCGIVPRDGIFMSDHLGLFVDIRVEGIPKAVKMEEGSRRYLKSGNKKNREKYLGHVEQSFKRSAIYQKIAEIVEKESQGVPDEVLEELLNEVDGEIGEILQEGEKSLAPSRADCFSGELKEYKKERKYWRRLRKGKNLTHSILNRVWSGHEKENWRMSDKDMRVRMRQLEHRIQEYYKNKEERRGAFLDELAEEYREKGQAEKEHYIKEIRKKERRKIEYRIMKSAMTDRRQKVEPSVEVPRGARTVPQMWTKIKGPGAEPDNWGPEKWERVTGRKEVEDIMVPWCAEHFSQAAETPFAQGKWNDELDILKEGSRVDEILDGKYDGIENEPEEVRQWLEGMKRKEGVAGQVPLRTTFAAFQEFVQRVTEAKSSSPSGRHYGHYKALATE